MTDMPRPFVFPIRIYYEDTDAAGIVYHANYIKFAERARTEWLRALGYDHHLVLKEFGLVFMIKHIEINYRAPARLDDALEVQTNMEAFGNSSFTMQQNIIKDGTTLADLKVTIVAVNAQGRPERVPPQLRQIFEAQGA